MSAKTTIELINTDNKILQELKSIVESALYGVEFKRRRQRHLVGECIICGSIPTKKVSYDVDGAKLVQKYCNKCFKKWAK